MSTYSLSAEFLAGWLYATQAQLRDWSLPAAPGWRFAPHVNEVMRIVRPGLDQIQASVVQTSEPHVWEAPGPWHAALYCQMLQHHASASGSRFLFRGHRCSSWKLEPALLRPGVDREREARRASLFSQLLSSISFNTMRLIVPGVDLYLRMSPDAYIAAAQHYDIKTALLDFTTDPDVAVWFATSGGDSDDGMAAIHILPIEMAEQMRLSLLLPPPFAQRLYLQRGMFVRAESTLDPAGIITIRFPWRPSASATAMREFQVLREGGLPVDLLPAQPSLGAAVTLADRILDGDIGAGSREAFDALARQLKPALYKALGDPLQAWAGYVDAFEDTLHSCVYAIDFDNNLSVDIKRLTLFVRSNVETCCSIASMYRAIPKLGPRLVAAVPAGTRTLQSQLADLIDNIAAREMNYVHSREAQRYAKQTGSPEHSS